MNERTTTLARRASMLLLASLAACGGRYDIGDVSSRDAAGGNGTTNGGATNTSDQSVGGSSTSGSSSANGATATGGSSAGTTSSGGSTSGPSPSRALNPTCQTQALPAAPLSYGTLISPQVLAQRVGLLLEGDATLIRAVPSVTTPETAADLISLNLAADHKAGSIPFGLRVFIEQWRQLGGSGADRDSVVQADATVFTTPGSTLGDLLAAETWKDPALNRLNSTIPARGSMLLDAVFCRVILLPLGAVSPTAPLSSPGKTRRQALTADEKAEPACLGCHSELDPLGWSLENIDTTGAFRTTDESGNPIDASGTFTSPGEAFPVSTTFVFENIDDLAPQFLDSCEAVRCFAEWYAQLELGALGTLGDLGLSQLSDDELDFVVTQFTQNQLTLESLLRAFVQTPTFLQE